MGKGIAVLSFAVLLATVGAALADVTLEEAVVCTAVADRNPEGAGTAFPADVGRLFAFTKVKGVAAPGTITHRWIREGETKAEVTLEVKGSPWRVWSSKQIPPAWAGAWKVEIADGSGPVLKALEFTVGVVAGAEEQGAR